MKAERNLKYWRQFGKVWITKAASAF